jgi:transcriptional regulator GlxA family with amidase domain
MARITFIAYDHCMFSGVAILIDAFSITNLWLQKFGHHPPTAAPPGVPLFETEIVTPGGSAGHCQRRCPDTAGQGYGSGYPYGYHIDTTYLFGVHPLPDEMDAILPWLVSHYERDVRVGASCTGVFVLAMTGLLDGRVATTNWQVIKPFRRRFPHVRLKPEHILTEDSGLICSGAVAAQYNLALYLIEVFGSQALSRGCAKMFLVDPSRSTQAPYMSTHFSKRHGDREILKAQYWLEQHYRDSITIDAAARHVGLSPRHFKRRFKKAVDETPLKYLQQIRLEAAKTMLETTADTIGDITRQVGYEDSSTFRRLFKTYTALSPREYRDKFSIRTRH